MVPSFAVAEIATGIGIWLFELGRHLATPAACLCGLDIITTHPLGWNGCYVDLTSQTFGKKIREVGGIATRI